VKLEYLDCRLYAENDLSAENNVSADAKIQPTFVEVLKRSLPDQQTLAKEAQQIANLVAEVLCRPVENVHALYLPPGEGRIAFGGKLLINSNEVGAGR
jgi:hypothetical protein